MVTVLSSDHTYTHTNTPYHHYHHHQPSSKRGGGRGAGGRGAEEEEDEFGDGYPHHVEARPARDDKEAAFPGLRMQNTVRPHLELPDVAMVGTGGKSRSRYNIDKSGKNGLDGLEGSGGHPFLALAHLLLLRFL